MTTIGAGELAVLGGMVLMVAAAVALGVCAAWGLRAGWRKISRR